jgi:hypothetical protein
LPVFVGCLAGSLLKAVLARVTSMRASRQHLAVVVMVSLGALACQQGATVEGEISNGATKGSFQKVSLVRNGGDSLTSAIDALCAAERADVQRRTERVQVLQAGMERFKRRESPTLSGQAQVALSDSVEKYREAASDAQRALTERPDTISEKILALVEAATDTQVEATMQGRFRFTKRQPGKYLLYAEWINDRGSDQFVAPVDARDRSTTRQNLDQSAISARLHCR